MPKPKPKSPPEITHIIAPDIEAARRIANVLHPGKDIEVVDTGPASHADVVEFWRGLQPRSRAMRGRKRSKT